MRLFIAVDFNEFEGYFHELQSLLPKNAKLNLTKVFHLTLKFLGEVQPKDAKAIIRVLKPIKFDGFHLFLDSIGVFPSESYIRVMWVGLNPADNILDLQKVIDDSLKSMFKKENCFKPHITLARVKYVEDKKSFAEKLKNIEVEKKKIEIKEFKLIKSTLSPKGPSYEDLAVFG